MKYELNNNGVASIALDNGKVNALSKTLIEDLIDALKRAESEAKGVVLSGNPGMFSAGFDIAVVKQGIEAATNMFLAGFDLLETIYSHPQPVIVASEGHAIGMGVFMLLCADYRIGAKGQFTYKLPETEIGLPFSPILKIIGKNHIDARYHNVAMIQSAGFSPDEAREIGILDEVVDADSVLQAATKKAESLIKLPAQQYKENKLFVRAEIIKLLSESRGL